MNLELLFVGVLPLVLFIIIDLKFGMKWGIYSAIILALVIGVYYYIKLSYIDYLLFFELILLIILGFISIKLNNSKFFKFQPTIISLIVGLYIAYLQVFVSPILIRYLPLMTSINPQLSYIIHNPNMMRFLYLVSLHMIPIFFIHALLVAYAAVRLNNIMWIIMRLSIYPLLLFLFVIDSIIVKLGL